MEDYEINSTENKSAPSGPLVKIRDVYFFYHDGRFTRISLLDFYTDSSVVCVDGFYIFSYWSDSDRQYFFDLQIKWQNVIVPMGMVVRPSTERVYDLLRSFSIH